MYFFLLQWYTPHPPPPNPENSWRVPRSYIFHLALRFPVLQADLQMLVEASHGRALYGPMPVKTETFRELWGPLVHTFSWGNSYGPIIGPYLFLGKFVWTNGAESSSKVSPYTDIGPWMALPSLLGDTQRPGRHLGQEHRRSGSASAVLA